MSESRHKALPAAPPTDTEVLTRSADVDTLLRKHEGQCSCGGEVWLEIKTSGEVVRYIWDEDVWPPERWRTEYDMAQLERELVCTKCNDRVEL